MKKKMQQDKQINLKEAPSVFYTKFFNRFNEIDTVPIKDWEAVHLISYFCKKYEQHYGLKYTFKFNAAPSKSYEVMQIKRISNMMTSDPEVLKNYIDHIFEEIVVQKKKRITSIALLSNTDIVNNYKFKYLFNKQGNDKMINVDRSTILSEDILNTIRSYGVEEINTYGELAFAYASNNDKYKLAISAIIGEGFDVNILSKIK